MTEEIRRVEARGYEPDERRSRWDTDLDTSTTPSSLIDNWSGTEVEPAQTPSEPAEQPGYDS
ncbi:hypothetical protein [Asanoa siamensis]|uniref:Uncharacterized protein n=1 Tax=Asanoa siamensis TaxID=926357 RepID=A0ABQ4CWH1_9ACTN|nr:hypothetical protein [Asanoa siamensis]GIF75646.1 hypothetical protein Asi02nite_51640 [Asanoa siamensis]